MRYLGIPFVQPIWGYSVTNLVVDFKFGQGLNRRSEWEELNDIFQNAVKQSYQREATTQNTIVRHIKEEQASDSGRLEPRVVGKTPNDGFSTDDDISILEMMPDIWKYACPRDVEVSASGEAVFQEGYLNNVNAFRDLQILDNSDGGLSNQLTPSNSQDIVPDESSGNDAVRYASPLNQFRVHNTINGRYAIRPRMGDTLHMQPSRQLPPSEQQQSDPTTSGKTLYEYSWTGM